MPLTPPARPELPADLLSSPLPIERVLYEAEYPVVYVSRTNQGQLLLAYVADESEAGVATLLAPIGNDRLSALERGIIAVREALTSSWLWLHMSDGESVRAWAVQGEEIPNEFLPLAGTPLLPEHEPVLRTRAIGESVVPGRMPASVVAFVADATRKAVKTLLDHAFATPSEGRPTEEHRALYDLPITRFAFASFELSFAPPEEGMFPSEEVRKAAERLETGLLWAEDTASDAPLDVRAEEERAAVLRAALLLTPPASGAITEVQVSGTWMKHGTVRLTRASRRKVRQALRRVEHEQVVMYHGRIGELDVDNLSFILRDTEDGRERQGTFAEELLEDMMLYFTEAGRVTALGVERQGRLHIAAVAQE